MNCRNPKCKVGQIIRNQYGAEGDYAFRERVESGYCRSKCRREHEATKPKADRPRPTLALTQQPLYGEVREGIISQPKEKTPRDAAYLDFVRTFDCIGCGWPAHLKNIDAHHIETGGTAIKCSDYLTVPLCNAEARGCHPAADKAPETADGFRPYALLLNRLWKSAGHKIKKGGE